MRRFLKAGGNNKVRGIKIKNESIKDKKRILTTSSMAPYIVAGDYCVINKLAYVADDIERGDVIISTVSDRAEDGNILIKRIIGLPGEHISFDNGKVYINGQIYYEEYLSDDIETNCIKSFDIPTDCYFAMGDNRLDSYDSRYWDDPYLKKSRDTLSLKHLDFLK